MNVLDWMREILSVAIQAVLQGAAKKVDP